MAFSHRRQYLRLTPFNFQPSCIDAGHEHATSWQCPSRLVLLGRRHRSTTIFPKNATKVPACRMSSVTTAWVAPPGAGAETTTGALSSSDSSRSILIGGCSTPSWTLVDISTAASVINLIGCGWDRTACCPYAVAAPTGSPVSPFPTPQGGAGDFPLTQCPADYQAISNGCCPLCVMVLPQIFHSRRSTMDRSVHMLTQSSLFHHSGFHTAFLGTQLIICNSRVPSRLPVPTLPSTSTTVTTKPTVYVVDAVYAAYLPLTAGTTTGTATGTTTGTTTGTITDATTSISTTTPSGGDSPLSHNAAIGIGVGTGVAVLTLAGVIYLLVRRTRGKKRAREPDPFGQGQGLDRGSAAVAEMAGAQYHGGRMELDGDGYRREMPG